jgi:hypothetical protein
MNGHTICHVLFALGNYSVCIRFGDPVLQRSSDWLYYNSIEVPKAWPRCFFLSLLHIRGLLSLDYDCHNSANDALNLDPDNPHTHKEKKKKKEKQKQKKRG